MKQRSAEPIGAKRCKTSPPRPPHKGGGCAKRGSRHYCEYNIICNDGLSHYSQAGIRETTWRRIRRFA